jgi:hypothetical protein
MRNQPLPDVFSAQHLSTEFGQVSQLVSAPFLMTLAWLFEQAAQHQRNIPAVTANRSTGSVDDRRALRARRARLAATIRWEDQGFSLRASPTGPFSWWRPEKNRRIEV